MAPSTTAVPLDTFPSDLETGKKSSSDSEQSKKRRSAAEGEGGELIYYYAIYGFSVFISVVGASSYFLPFSENRIVGAIAGASALVTGGFTMLNGDLLVTYLRLWRESGRFKQNNRRFRASLIQQKSQIQKLKETEKALATYGGRQHKSLNRFHDEEDEMTATARDFTKENISAILMLARIGKREIMAGEDLQSTLKLFECCYVFAFPQILARFEEMMKGFDASPRWKRVGSLSNDRLKFIITGTFFEDIKDIKEWVRSHIEAETDELASGWFANERDAEVLQAETSQFDKHFEEESLSPEDAPTVAKPVAKEDSWAEAIAFAGLD